MFPGAGASVYYNEAGEPLGWDYPSYDEPEYDPDDYLAGYDDDYEEHVHTCRGCDKEFDCDGGPNADRCTEFNGYCLDCEEQFEVATTLPTGTVRLDDIPC